MSLSKQVRDTESPVRLFFREHLPRTRPVVRDCNANQLKGLETISPSIGSRRPTTVNTALHYRLNYYFATPPFAELNAWTKALLYYPDERSAWYDVPSELQGFFRSLTFFLRSAEPAGRRLDDEQERLLLRYCFALALFEAHPHSPDSPLERLRGSSRATTVADFLDLAEDHEIDDLCRLSRGLYSQLGVPASESAEANAKFVGSADVGGAAADLISDGCLIDVKVTKRPELRNTMLYQLLGYALLDYADLYRIREVGIYFSRQEKLVKWPLEGLISTMASHDAQTLGDLRESFKAHLEQVYRENSRGAPATRERNIRRNHPRQALPRNRRLQAYPRLHAGRGDDETAPHPTPRSGWKTGLALAWRLRTSSLFGHFR